MLNVQSNTVSITHVVQHHTSQACCLYWKCFSLCGLSNEVHSNCVQRSSNECTTAGAEQITLEGVYHSPLGGGALRPWYGSPEIIDQWIRVVYDKDLDTDYQVELGNMLAPKN